MKAGIITHYDVHNHGAHLQLYALSSELRRLGYDAYALQYKKNYDFMDSDADKKYRISLKSIPFYVQYAIKNGLRKTVYNLKKRRVLGTFRAGYELVGEYYSQAGALDALIIGSDEIFSIEPGLNPCFWGMGVPANKIVSYAASFGPTTFSFIEEHNAVSFIKGGIENIDVLSVRDRNSQDIVRCLGNKEAPIVCDPVLLHDFSREIKEIKKPIFNKKYCLVYSYDKNMNDEITIQAIKKYAGCRGLRVFSVGFYHRWCDKNIQAGPLELMAWFRDAEMVFTDTFHGSVISLVTRTQFVAQIKGNGNKLSFLLEQYGVQNRKVEQFSEINAQALTPIDFGEVEKTVDRIRAESFQYLLKALGENCASL